MVRVFIEFVVFDVSLLLLTFVLSELSVPLVVVFGVVGVVFFVFLNILFFVGIGIFFCIVLNIGYFIICVVN